MTRQIVRWIATAPDRSILIESGGMVADELENGLR